MCLPKAIVIVIVKSRNGEGARFKYINVRKESRMVARLPQQVFLLLVLVSGTTTGTVYRAELSSGTTEPSFRRMATSAPRLSQPTSLKGHETWSKSSVHGKRSSGSMEEGITVSTELPTSRNFRSSQVFLVLDVAEPSSTLKRRKMKNGEGEVERGEESKRNVVWNEIKNEKFSNSKKNGLAHRDSLEVATLRGEKNFETPNRTEITRPSRKIIKTADSPTNCSNHDLRPVVTSQMSMKIQLTTSKPLTLKLTREEQITPINVPLPRHLSTITLAPTLNNDIHKITPGSERYANGKFDWLTSERINVPVTTLQPTAVGFPKRYARDTETDPCEKFLITDNVKREFYSPNYPQNYPPKANCVRTLEAEKGMLLKLDFRDRFELESMTPINGKVGECRFDYLEVRDGQYGFSNLLGIFCDKQFPPEIVSKSRHLWLRFRSDDTIEYQGFKAVWSTIPRPTSGGVPPEQEPCVRNVSNFSDTIISIDDVAAEKKIAVQHKVALDCLWIITAPADTRMQITFDDFDLAKPNDCSANFLDVFDQQTDIPSRLKNFCGSMAEAVHSVKNITYIRFYLEPKAINSTFKSLITVVREKGSTDKPCRDDEYDCEDNTCIALSLKCNKRYNCRFLRDEDATMCGTTGDQFDSSRVIIILVIFSLIMFGMCFTFVFNCVRKLMRDHRIIREHIRQSRENRLDEIGRKTTPCPVSLSRTDLRDRGSESPSVEVDSSKELIPTTMIAHEYTKELVLEMKYGTKDVNDIHQSNNVSNATQERLQESSEELEMCDSSCQTRESLFEPRILDANISSPPFSTFGYKRSSEGQNGVSPSRRATPQQSEDRHRHYHQHPHPPTRQCSQHSHQSHPSNSPPSRHPVSEQCSVCLSSNSREGSIIICPKHNPIPAPPGWSLHDPPYPLVQDSRSPEDVGCMSYKRYQSPKPDRTPSNARNNHHQQLQSPVYNRQNTVGSGERYDSLMYGSARASSNTASNTTTGSNVTGSGSQHSATQKYTKTDPRYRAEAVIEVDQKRPFSIESTKSAPDVIATH